MMKFVMYLKKTMFTLLFIFMIYAVDSAKAANIDSLTIKGPKTAKVGDQFTVSLKAATSGYQTNEGIWLVYVDLKYDKNTLDLVKVISPGYATSKDYNDSGVILVSEAIENSGISGSCVNGLLQCGSYDLALNFQVTTANESKNITIQAAEFGIGTLNITEYRDYTEDDVIETNYPNSVSFDMTVNPIEENKVESTTVTTTEKNQNSVTTKKNSSTQVTSTSTKSNNNYLKTLEITNYPINFNKENTSYDISINNIETLDIKAVPESDKASSKVIGNENLKNGGTVKIIVTAEDGTTREYKLNVKTEKVFTYDGEKSKSEVKPDTKFDPNIIRIAIIIGVVFAILPIMGVIAAIGSISDKRKLNKMLKEEK